MVEDGSNQTETEAWKAISKQINEAKSKLQMYKEEKAGMESSGANVTATGTGLSSGSKIQSLGMDAKSAASVAGEYLKQLRAQITMTVKNIPVIGRLLTESAYLGRKGFSLLAFAVKNIGAGITKAGGAIASLI